MIILSKDLEAGAESFKTPEKVQNTEPTKYKENLVNEELINRCRALLPYKTRKELMVYLVEHGGVSRENAVLAVHAAWILNN